MSKTKFISEKENERLETKEKVDFFQDYAINAENGQLEGLQQTRRNIHHYSYLKRVLDIMFALIMIPVVLPVVLLFCIIIKLETPGSAFFLQERVGLNGKYFNIIKLRSMGINAEQNGAQWAEKNDPRVTKVGSFIRKTRIDELPQLINVLKGDMSLIGPRPERPIFTNQFNQEIPGFIERLEIRPGLTGWAQVNGGYDISPKEKLDLDRYYIQQYNFLMDLKILLITIMVCITGSGAR